MSTNQLDGVATPNAVAVPPLPVVSDDVRAAADRLGVGQYFDEVIAFTVEIFGSFLSVELVPDPEVPDWEHIVFEVPVTGTVENIMNLSDRWLERSRATVAPAPLVFSFVMDYVE